MQRRRALSRWCFAVSLAGTVWVNGCLANLERNIDLVLSPGALDNAWRAPYSAVSGFVEFFARYVL